MQAFFLLAGILSGAQAAPTSPLLSLDQALALADRDAFAILVQQTLVERRRASVSEAAAGLGPKVDLSGTATQYDKATEVQFGSDRFTVLPHQVAAGTASLVLPIDISGNLHRLVAESKARLYAQRATLEASRSDTRRLVRLAYYAVLRAQSEAKVAQEALDSNAAQQKNTELRFAQGVVANVDVVRAQTQTAQSRADLIVAQNAVDLAKQRLNGDLARPVDTPIEVVDVDVLPNPSTDAVALAKLARAQRPEAEALVQTEAALRQATRSAETGNLPSLSIQAGTTATAKPLGFGQRADVYEGQVAITWPIWDSGVARARVKEARQDEAQAKVQLAEAREEISLDVHQAVTNLVDAAARLKVSEGLVKTASTVLHDSEVRFQQGVGISLEVVDARRDLTAAETAQVAARYDYLSAVADLQHAIGSDELPPAPGAS